MSDEKQDGPASPATHGLKKASAPKEPSKSTARRMWKPLREPRYAYLLVGFLLFTLIGAIVVFRGLATIKTAAGWDGWSVSLGASFLEDWVFFVVVGGAIALFSFARPEEDEIRRRVRFLYNGRNVTNDAIDYFESIVRSECTFSPRFEYQVTYSEYDASLGAIKATVQLDRSLVNMLSDRDYATTDVGCSVYTDDIAGLTGPKAEVMIARISYDDGTAEDFVSTPLKVFRAKENVPVSVKLRPDGSAKLLFKFWVWHKVGEPYIATAQRYSDYRNVEIINASEQEIHLNIGPQKERLTLTPGERKAILTPRVPRGSEQLFVLDRVSDVINPGGGA